MAFCGLLAFVLGYCVGHRFRVTVVLPIEALGIVAAVGSALSGFIGTGAACLGFIVFSVAVQSGYGLALACPVRTRQPLVRAVKA